MESLNTLVTSLPTAQQNAEKELLNNFKAAALSITTLYRSSRQNSKRAYNAGYAAACQDLLTMIQQGVSVDGIEPSQPVSTHSADGVGMTIGKVMDWTEARLEAIKSREEEEEEEEEKEKEKERGRATSGASSARPTSDEKSANRPVIGTSASQPKDHALSLPTPNSPHSHSGVHVLSEPSSPSPPSLAALRPIQRSSKLKPPTKGDISISHTIPVNTFPPSFDVISDGPSPMSSQSTPFPTASIPLVAGAKRRHAMMMMLDSSSTPASIGGSSTSPTGTGNGIGYGNNLNHGSGIPSNRRRTRSSRNLTFQQSQNQNLSSTQATSEVMDVEEDGRERKRIARR